MHTTGQKQNTGLRRLSFWAIGRVPIETVPGTSRTSDIASRGQSEMASKRFSQNDLRLARGICRNPVAIGNESRLQRFLQVVQTTAPLWSDESLDRSFRDFARDRKTGR